MKHRYYPSLDGLRTVAVAIVLAAHGGISFFRSGGVGVDIFFVLSGFLITTILAAEFAATGTISYRNFYVRRVLRLAPGLFLTCAFVGAWQGWIEGDFPGRQILIALTYTSNWARGLYDVNLGWLTHTWSLAVEEQFYLVWPWIILFAEKKLKDPLVKGLLMVAAALLVSIYRGSLSGFYTVERINYGLDTRMDTLMLGAALAYFARALGPQPLPAQVSLWLGRFLAPVALAGLLVTPRIVTWYSPWMGRFGYVIVAAGSFVVIADLVMGRHSLLARPLAWSPLVYIGKISYGLYLLHLPVYFIFEKYFPTMPFVLKLTLKLVVSVAVATVSYYCVERRFLKLKSRFESKPVPSLRATAQQVITVTAPR